MDLKYVLIFLLIIPFVSGSIRINEVMADPDICPDSVCEWVELYNPLDILIDLSNWKFCDIKLLAGYVDNNDELTYLDNGMVLQPQQYAIITDGGTGTLVYDNFNVNGDALALHVDANTLCGGLSNEGELISLEDESELVDAIRYYGLVKEGKSLCNINNIWQECSATPGSENNNLINHTIRINELFPDPQGDDDADMPFGEWVELYNFGNENLDLEGLSLQDNFGSEPDIFISESNTLSGTTIGADDYLVVYMNGLSSFLNNENFEKISLYKGNNLIDEVSYSGSSESYSWSLINNNWKVTTPTPDSSNIYQNETGIVDYIVDGDTLELENGKRVRLIGIDTPETGEYYYKEAKDRLKKLVEGKTVILGVDIENKDMYNRLLRYIYVDDLFVNLILVEEGYAKAYPYEPNTKYKERFASAETEAKNKKIGIWADFLIKINEFFPNPQGYDNAAIPEGEWIELYNYGNEINLEGFYLKDDYGHKLVISDVKTLSGTIIKANDYLVVYANGFSGLLNNDGYEKISLYKEDYLLDEVSYSGSSEGLTWSRINDKWVLSLPTPNSQNYNNESDITISRLNVDKIYDLGNDNIAKFGQIIRIKLLVYKGDTNKESIKFYIEDEDGERVSKESKVNVEDKFMNYTFTTPIQLIPNCNQKFNDGIYNIVISGLEDTDKEKIEIEGITPSLCEVVKEVKETISTSVSSDSESVLNGEYITGSVVYEGDEQGSYAVYFFCFSLISVILYLLIKNE